MKMKPNYDREKVQVLVGLCRLRNYLIDIIYQQLIVEAFPTLDIEHVIEILNIVLRCYEFARSVTTNLPLQNAMSFLDSPGTKRFDL